MCNLEKISSANRNVWWAVWIVNDFPNLASSYSNPAILVWKSITIPWVHAAPRSPSTAISLTTLPWGKYPLYAAVSRQAGRSHSWPEFLARTTAVCLLPSPHCGQSWLPCSRWATAHVPKFPHDPLAGETWSITGPAVNSCTRTQERDRGILVACLLNASRPGCHLITVYPDDPGETNCQVAAPSKF